MIDTIRFVIRCSEYDSPHGSQKHRRFEMFGWLKLEFVLSLITSGAATDNWGSNHGIFARNMALHLLLQDHVLCMKRSGSEAVKR